MKSDCKPASQPVWAPETVACIIYIPMSRDPNPTLCVYINTVQTRGAIRGNAHFTLLRSAIVTPFVHVIREVIGTELICLVFSID